MTATRIGNGVYRIEQAGCGAEIVYIAGPPDDWWAFWNGQIFRGPSRIERAPASRPVRAEGVLLLTAPMPATVTKVLVETGSTIQRGSIVVVLEAMKMEMPIRSPRDAVVQAVRCRPGDVVQADDALVVLE